MFLKLIFGSQRRIMIMKLTCYSKLTLSANFEPFTPRNPFFTNVTHSVARVRLKYHQNTYKGSRPVVFCKKSVLKDFAKVIGKHLRQSVFFDKVAGLRHSSESKSSALTR